MKTRAQLVLLRDEAQLVREEAYKTWEEGYDKYQQILAVSLSAFGLWSDLNTEINKLDSQGEKR